MTKKPSTAAASVNDEGELGCAVGPGSTGTGTAPTSIESSSSTTTAGMAPMLRPSVPSREATPIGVLPAPPYDSVVLVAWFRGQRDRHPRVPDHPPSPRHSRPGRAQGLRGAPPCLWAATRRSLHARRDQRRVLHPTRARQRARRLRR